MRLKLRTVSLLCTSLAPPGLSRGGALEVAELWSRLRRVARPGLLSFHSSELAAVSREESLFPGFARRAGSLSSALRCDPHFQSCSDLEAHLCFPVVFLACPVSPPLHPLDLSAQIVQPAR